jgi:hypothetical protein
MDVSLGRKSRFVIKRLSLSFHSNFCSKGFCPVVSVLLAIDMVTTKPLVLFFEVTLLFPLNFNQCFHFCCLNYLLMKKTCFPSAAHREGIS